MKTEAAELTGTVESLYCERPTFCAGKFRTPRAYGVKFTVKGYVRAGQQCTLRGKWVEHPKYGKQFEAAEVVVELPTNPAGIAQWIAWNVQGAGHATAQKLVDEFGADLMPLALQDPGQVAATCGVKIEIIEEIAAAWQSQSNRIAVQSRLAGFGLTQYQVEAIVSKFGSTAATVIEENPYMLLGCVDGLGFKTIDEIAIKTGMPRNDPRRVAAAIQWTVKQSVNDDGNTCLPHAVAVAKATEFLGFDVEGVEEIISGHQGLVHINAGTVSIVATRGCYANESFLWKWFARSREPNGYDGDIEKDSATVNMNGENVTLDESQAAAVRMALSNRCSVITGGAGAGKTLVAKAVEQAFRRAGRDVYLIAPTGKAARRLAEVTGHQAATIHRTLGFSPDGGFLHHADNPLPAGVYLVDEVSMVDSALMFHLVSALPEPSEGNDGTTLVLIGDENQLPPVGPGAVLRDIIAGDIVPAARLTKCHRQAGTLKTNAAAILAGKVEATEQPAWIVHKGLRDASQVVKAVESLYENHLQAWGFDAVRGTQFMTAVHRGPLGTKYLNRLLQYLHQRSIGVELDRPSELDDRRPPLYLGDKVIHTKNNYKLGVMNGTVGIVVGTNPLIVEYEDGEIEYPEDCRGQVELAYVLTPHKMQGSEVPCAVVICHRANQFIQTRNWLYTAATRARKTCVIIGDEESIRRAAARTDANNRTTLLNVFAQCEEARP